MYQVIVRTLEGRVVVLSQSMLGDDAEELAQQFCSDVPIHIRECNTNEMFSLNPDSYQYLTISLIELNG